MAAARKSGDSKSQHDVASSWQVVHSLCASQRPDVQSPLIDRTCHAPHKRRHCGRRRARDLWRLQQPRELPQAGRQLCAIRSQEGPQVGGQQRQSVGTRAKGIGIGAQGGTQPRQLLPPSCRRVGAIQAVGRVASSRTATGEKQSAQQRRPPLRLAQA